MALDWKVMSNEYKLIIKLIEAVQGNPSSPVRRNLKLKLNGILGNVKGFMLNSSFQTSAGASRFLDFCILVVLGVSLKHIHPVTISVWEIIHQFLFVENTKLKDLIGYCMNDCI